LMHVLVLLFLGIVQAQTCKDLDPNDRLPCWSWFKYDLTEERCLERGCCWSPSIWTDKWCYYASPATAITDVHVVQGAHLDIGFLETGPDIVNLWFHTHFPRAWQLGKQFEAMGNTTTAGIKFTSQSYLISLFFDCPSDYFGVICPNATLIAMVEECIAKDWITWHAFPFNGELETMDPDLIEFGLQMTHDLDKRFNKQPKTVLSQRDVPGMTVNVLPILKRNGIKGISVGVNGGSTPPDVTNSFIWKNPVTSDTVRAFYVQGGYSGRPGILPWDRFTWTGVPGSSHVMVVDWRGDNAGPPLNVEEIFADWKLLEAEFPNAHIHPSSFDDYLWATMPIPDDHLPLIDKEIGDTWIHGIASDPLKLGKMRLVQKLRSECIDQGLCHLSDSRFYEFSRYLLKNGEHTWGLDNKIALPDYIKTHWTNNDLLQTIIPSAGGQSIIESWHRQRNMGLDYAIAALGDHPLAGRINKYLDEHLAVKMPDLTGFSPISPNNLPPYFKVGPNVQIGFDKATGSINHLMVNSTIWASPDSPLALLEYRTYDEADYYNFMVNYNYLYYLFGFDDLYDYDKVGINTGGAQHRVVNPKLTQFYAKVSPFDSRFVLQVGFPQQLNSVAGTPNDVWVSVHTFPNGTSHLEVNLFDKNPTRLPEATFLRFVGTGGTWQAQKLGLAMSPYNVTTGGGKHMHSIGEELVLSQGSSALHIAPLNSPLVTFGEPNAFPIPTDEEPDWKQGASFILHDNIWNTNYIMWYPYNAHSDDANITFKYRLDFV